MPLLLLLLLLFFPSQVQCLSNCQGKGEGYAQAKAALPSHYQQVSRQQVVREFIALILKADICALLDRCAIPPLSKVQRRSFFSIFAPAGQNEARLQRDKLIRHYIDRLRELIIAVHRLGITPKSEINYYPASGGSADHLATLVKIKSPPSPLAATISPDLDGKSVLLSFTLTVTCSSALPVNCPKKEGWKITDLSQSNLLVIQGESSGQELE